MNEGYTIFEEFELPSKGQVYENPVNPHIRLRSMLTEDEMWRLQRTDTPYKVMSELIDRCIVGEDRPGLSAYDMVLGDYTFLLHKLRTVTYGPDYKMIITCPFCKQINEVTVDLESLDVNVFSDETLKEMKITLPKSKNVIELRFQTPRMLDEIENRKKELKKKTKDRSSRYDYLLTLESLIKTVDGSVYTPAQLEAFILKLPMLDANYLLQKADKLNQKVGVSTTVTVECPDCGNEVVTPFLITSEFFGPTID